LKKDAILKKKFSALMKYFHTLVYFVGFDIGCDSVTSDSNVTRLTYVTLVANNIDKSVLCLDGDAD
jgi:hypothetical protein